MAKANAPIRATVVGLLSSLGGVVTEAPAEAPVVYAKVPSASLALFSDGRYSPDVLSVDLPDPAAPRTNIEEFYDSDDMEAKEAFLDNGWHGNGIKVGLHEHVDGCGLWRAIDGQGQIVPRTFKDWSGFWVMQPAATRNCGTAPEGAACSPGCGNQEGYCRSGVCVAYHATKVVSNIAASVDCTNCGPYQDRYANKARIYFGNTGLVTQRHTWFHNNNVKVVNESQDPNATNANNYAVRNWYVTLLHSAGNEGVTFPVGCYANAICVGTAQWTSSQWIPALVNHLPVKNGGYSQRCGRCLTS